MQYKRYDRFVLSGAFCVLLTIAVFNYWMDPGNIFGNDVLVKTCGKWLLEGHDVAITQNYDERLLQKYLIEHDTKNYEVLILGSSRTMDIGENLFPGRAVKNYSVSGASIEDDIALYFLYEQLHGKPQKVIIGADAWLLNANSGQSRWKSIFKEYAYGKGRMQKGEKIADSKSFEFEKYTQLLSWPYLKESIKFLRKGKMLKDEHGYCLADDKATVIKNAGIICSDGTHIPSIEAQARDAEPLARQYIAGDVYSLEKYDEVNAGLQSQIREFISYLKSQEIEIVLYLTPYHPIVYSYLLQNEKYHNAVEAEAFFRDVAEEKKLTVIGSYNPQRCGLSNADFLDGMHMRKAAVERIFIAEPSGPKWGIVADAICMQ